MGRGRQSGVTTALLVFLASFFGFSAPVCGHLPTGTFYKAFQFPDRMVPEIDGDLGDWNVVAPSYIISTEDFFDLIREDAEFDLVDFSIRLMIGWNKTGNKLFIAAQVSDDVHQIDRRPGTAAVRIFQDDDMEVFLDADHSGGQYANFVDVSPEEQIRLNGASANHFVIAGPPPDEDFFVNFSAAAWYALPDGPFSMAAYALDETPETGSIMTYEMMLVPFDRLNMDAAFLSKEHLLQENEILGFNVEFGDYDHSSELLDAKWSLSGGQNGFRFSERFADLMLMPLEDIFRPTAVKSQSWAQIKAFFGD